MIFTYATEKTAIQAIPGFCSQMEQDIFVYHVTYPFGDEFSLRTRNQIIDEDSPRVIYKFFLPFEYCFSNRTNALRELCVWKERLKTEIILDRHYKVKNGYNILSHYTLKT